MKRAGNVLHDFGLALLAGAVGGAVLLIVLLLVGTAVNGFQLRQGFVVARGGLLVTGALCLFVCAGLLIRPRKGEQVSESDGWRRRFRALGLLSVIAIVAVVLIAMASVLDYLLYFT